MSLTGCHRCHSMTYDTFTHDSPYGVFREGQFLEHSKGLDVSGDLHFQGFLKMLGIVKRDFTCATDTSVTKHH